MALVRVGARGSHYPFLTSKERDIETGLDYFLARYYSNVQGRFTSVDPEQEGARTDDPQSWNGYGYARSSPLVYSDPDGREYLVCDPEGKNCTKVSDEQFQAERTTLKKDGNIYTGSGNFYESGQIKNADGGLVATYVQISIDDLSHRRLAAIAGAVDPIPLATAQFFGISLVAGVTGGGAVYALSSAPAVTTLGLSGGAATSEVSAASLAAQLKFTATVAARQGLASRRVPLQTIAQAILSGQRMADPQNAPGAVKIVQEIFVNGKKYQLEIIYREADKTILHLLYK